MLSELLNTNEVRDSAGSEIEFQTLEKSGRKHVFAKIGESPAYQHRLTVSHEETGAGSKRVKRSMLRVDITSLSEIDNTTLVTDSAYIVVVTPVGGHTTTSKSADALANVLSSVGTTNGTTLVLNGTGTVGSALLSGAI